MMMIVNTAHKLWWPPAKYVCMSLSLIAISCELWFRLGSSLLAYVYGNGTDDVTHGHFAGFSCLFCRHIFVALTLTFVLYAARPGQRQWCKCNSRADRTTSNIHKVTNTISRHAHHPSGRTKKQLLNNYFKKNELLMFAATDNNQFVINLLAWRRIAIVSIDQDIFLHILPCWPSAVYVFESGENGHGQSN